MAKNKLQLQQEITKLRKQLEEYERIHGPLEPIEYPSPALYSKILAAEQAAQNEIDEAIRTCVKTTGRAFHALTITETLKREVLFDLENCTQQKDAVKMLIDYCIKVGDWSNTMECKRWVKQRLG